MGATCKKPAKQQNNFSTQIAKNQETFGDLQFSFTTQKLSRVNCECLLFYTDHKLKIEKNKFLQQVSSGTAKKMQQFFQASLAGQQMKPGSSIIFQGDFEEITFEYICVLCLGVWGGAAQLTQPLQHALENAFVKIKSAGASRVAMTELDEQFGIPVDVAYTSITKAIYAQRVGFKTITYLCDTVTDQQQVKSAIMNFKVDQNVQVRKSSAYF